MAVCFAAALPRLPLAAASKLSKIRGTKTAFHGGWTGLPRRSSDSPRGLITAPSLSSPPFRISRIGTSYLRPRISLLDDPSRPCQGHQGRTRILASRYVSPGGFSRLLRKFNIFIISCADHDGLASLGRPALPEHSTSGLRLQPRHRGACRAGRGPDLLDPNEALAHLGPSSTAFSTAGRGRKTCATIAAPCLNSLGALVGYLAPAAFLVMVDHVAGGVGAPPRR